MALDLAGQQHYGGRANWDSHGNYYIMSEQPTTPCSGGVAGSHAIYVSKPAAVAALIEKAANGVKLAAN